MPPKKRSGAARRRGSNRTVPSEETKILFRLYIAPGEEVSLRALSNLTSICREHIDNCEIEVVDVLAGARRAKRDGISVTPTLVKVSPPPHWSVVGDLAEDMHILAMMKSRPPRRRGK